MAGYKRLLCSSDHPWLVMETGEAGTRIPIHHCKTQMEAFVRWLERSGRLRMRTWRSPRLIERAAPSIELNPEFPQL